MFDGGEGAREDFTRGVGAHGPQAQGAAFGIETRIHGVDLALMVRVCSLDGEVHGLAHLDPTRVLAGYGEIHLHGIDFLQRITKYFRRGEPSIFESFVQLAKWACFLDCQLK